MSSSGRDRCRHPAGDHDGGVRAGQGDEEGDRRAEAGQRNPEGGGEFLRGRARPATHTLVAFVDEHRDRFGGVEPICRVLTDHDCKIAPSTYYAHHKRLTAPSARTVRDAELKILIQEAYDANYRVYGARKIWRHLNRQGRTVARCTVERLMRELGITGAVPGKKVITTIPDPTAPRAPDLVNRDFVAAAPNRCWVADFTHVATFSGVVYVAFVVDTFSHRIVGWSASTTKQTRLVLDALDMGLWQHDGDQQPPLPGKLVHHSDARSQGGFNWSSQHLVGMEVLDGASSAGSGPGVASEAEVSGASEVSASCRGGVLGGDRQGPSH
ncbi:IS3 family transposase [Streptomyces sp. NPDC007883]|uniref:IS3 family transposase n=1 Tax=Streptomyces sp. NPDC007883 TaxID=3155116 RepID=UPI0033E86E55